MVESEKSDLKLNITPINPFIQRQQDVLILIADGLAPELVAEKLGISKNTVNKVIYEGIFPVIASATKRWPNSRGEAIEMCMGDVLFYKPQVEEDK